MGAQHVHSLTPLLRGTPHRDNTTRISSWSGIQIGVGNSTCVSKHAVRKLHRSYKWGKIYTSSDWPLLFLQSIVMSPHTIWNWHFSYSFVYGYLRSIHVAIFTGQRCAFAMVDMDNIKPSQRLTLHACPSSMAAHWASTGLSITLPILPEKSIATREFSDTLR